jgi:hypothetical protein
LIKYKLYQNISLACLRLGELGGFLVANFRGGGWYVGWEVIFEERLPDNVGRVADYAEYGELDDWCKVQRERCLRSRRISFVD